MNTKSIRFAAVMAAVIGAFAFQASAATVTTTGTGVGKDGDIKVQVTFDANKIQSIKVLSQNENPVLAEKVFTDLKDNVVKTNSTDLDAISGATFSSKGFLAAVKDAAKKAGVTLTKDGQKSLKKAASMIPAKSTYDVVVVGAGGAGFAAAIEAKNTGASVVMLEKMPTVGGNSLISGAEMNAARNWVQPKLGILDDSAERHAQDTYIGGDKKGDLEVIRTMTGNALSAAKWARDYIGVRFEPDNLFMFGGHTRKRALIPYGQTGTEFITKLYAKANELKIPVITNMKAVELIKDASGRVVGVKATMNGQNYEFDAKGGVVLATGGFGHNAAMVKKYDPSLDERFKSTDSPSATGEALYMAERAGAELVNMQYIQTYPICDPVSGSIELIADARFDGAILINQKGQRFVEELGRRDVISHAILAQPGSYCWVLWNDKIGNISKTVEAHPDEYSVFTKTGTMKTCGDLKCIAEFTKIPYSNLKATIDRVDSMTGPGNDKDFHNRGGLVDMSQGKYYVVKAVPSIHHTMGGIRINPKSQALDKNGKVIPGLYAAGEVTGVTHGTNRLGGNAYADILVFGRIAGEGAAWDALSLGKTAK
ncbi:flavocytochrome c [Mesosutterella multiformis]|jgi:urocanate reductase|uniref:Urocanate reductase n=1 Tax=Mesosutterella multiformis TaxID=2259133 RepID=A0A388SFZ1_9BURK|nr:flavocytochrome c [Mesosutterella multiformis]MBS5812214.1 flavocytochrome c [Sutterella sp.]RGU75931.1 flavocytochrome c [Sutterella sp. AF15-45LB]RGU77126.1 flavocytochrome c [Sutterella sp. AF15-44LB]RHH09038.1 flavocytochrome c [Sutterella sp. AM18-8-1]MBM6983491.1 flavocytochrome c [Mesosutterella multiformis]